MTEKKRYSLSDVEQLEKSIKIDRATFDRLDELILEKVQEERTQRGQITSEDKKQNKLLNQKSAALYGFGKHKDLDIEQLVTVNNLLKANPNIISFKAQLTTIDELKESYNFGDYLYKRKMDFHPKSKEKKPLTKVKFQSKIYVYSYFLFLDCFDLAEFQKKYMPNPSVEPASPLPKPQEDSDGFHYYIGAYYSFLKNRVKKLGFAIRQLPDDTYEVKEWGFHHRSTKDKDLVEYTGTAKLKHNYLFMHLFEPKEGYELNIIGYVNRHGFIEDKQLIRSSWQGVSKNGYPLSLEVLLIPSEKNIVETIDNSTSKIPGLEKEQSDVIKLYFMLQRRNYYISRTIYNKNIEEMVAKKVELTYHTDVKGIYRIWHFGFGFPEIIQSKLIIDENYIVTLYPYFEGQKHKRFRKQVCVLRITEKEKVCFSSYVGTKIYNHAIFDFSKGNSDNIFDGVFCSIGYDNRGIVGAYMVVQKYELSEAENIDVKPTKFDKDDKEKLRKYIKKHDLHKLRLALFDLHRRKNRDIDGFSNPDSRPRE